MVIKEIPINIMFPLKKKTLAQVRCPWKLALKRLEERETERECQGHQKWSDIEAAVLIAITQMRGEPGCVMRADRYIGSPSALHV